MKAKHHPTDKPLRSRSPYPPSCQVQAGGRLVWIENGQPMFYVDRPRKFPAHIRMRLRGRGREPRTGVVIEDVKWKQLGSPHWWRLPEYPTGQARSER